MTQTEEINIEQGSDEWLELRRTKITSTDASVIMGVNPWKKVGYLEREKRGEVKKEYCNASMTRGRELEPIARTFYNNVYGVLTFPKVFLKGWAMASLDAYDEHSDHLVEIKCPGENACKKAFAGIVDDCYFVQMQHQMYVMDLDLMYYFVFDGFFGHRIEVSRDQIYIDRMVKIEKEFYDSLFCVAD